MRNFDTGATRDVDTNKFDYEGFLHPSVLERYAEYMHKNRVQADGKIRDSDNWQKGMPKESYMKSMWRHFLDVWKAHRGLPTKDSLEDALAALMFNVMGYLYETIRQRERIRLIAEGVIRDNYDVLERLVDKPLDEAGHYTHRYGALAHDQEAIDAEDEDGPHPKFPALSEENYRRRLKDAASQSSDNPAFPGVSGVEYGEVLGICPQRTQSEVDALAAQVRDNGGRKA